MRTFGAEEELWLVDAAGGGAEPVTDEVLPTVKNLCTGVDEGDGPILSAEFKRSRSRCRRGPASVVRSAGDQEGTVRCVGGLPERGAANDARTPLRGDDGTFLSDRR